MILNKLKEFNLSNDVSIKLIKKLLKLEFILIY